MRKTETLGLPIYDSPETDLFKFQDWNEGNQKIEQSTYYVTPEMFGTKGDGVTDDTVYLQNAIDFAVKNKILLTSKGNKTYCISSPLNLFKENGLLMIDFNNSKIKATYNMSYICNWKQQDEYERSHFIKNIKLDCANFSNVGLYMEYSRMATLENIEIRDAKSVCIEIQRGNVKLAKSYFVRSRGDITFTEVVGIKNVSGATDSKFDMIYMRDIKFPIIDSGGACYYTKIHAWLETSDLVSGSIFAQFTNKANLIQCYFDTYETCIYKEGSNTISLTNCESFINMSFYTSTKEPTLFKADKGYNVACIFSSGCNFNFYSYFNSTGKKALFSNFTSAEIHYNFTKGLNRYASLVGLPPQLKSSQLNIVGNEITTPTNNLLIEEKMLNINIVINSTSTSGFNNTAYERILCSFPDTHRPLERETPYFVTGTLLSDSDVVLGTCNVKLTSIKNGSHNFILPALGETLKVAKKLVVNVSLLSDIKEVNDI